jgi:hypothetical protein
MGVLVRRRPGDIVRQRIRDYVRRLVRHAGQSVMVVADGVEVRQARSLGPKLLIHDDYTDVDNTNLTMHAISPINTVGATYFSGGSGWWRAGFWKVLSNKAFPTTGSVVAGVNAGTNNVLVSVEFTSSAFARPLVVRGNPALPGDNGFAIFKTGGGGSNAWGLYEVSFPAGYVLRASGVYNVTDGVVYTAALSAMNDTYSFSINGTPVLSYTGASTLSVNTYHGIMGYEAVYFDNFKVYQL